MGKENNISAELPEELQDQVDYYRDNNHMISPYIIESIAKAALKQGFLDGFIAGSHLGDEKLVSINDIGNPAQLSIIDVPLSEETIEVEEIGVKD